MLQISLHLVFQYSIHIAHTHRDILRYLSVLTELSDHESPEDYSARIYHAFFHQALFFQFPKVKELCNSTYDQVTWVMRYITAGQLPCECSLSLVRVGYYSERNMQAYIWQNPLLSLPIHSRTLFESLRPLRPPTPKHLPSDVSCTSANNIIRITFPRNFQFRT
jgi:hypothetical protein